MRLSRLLTLAVLAIGSHALAADPILQFTDDDAWSVLKPYAGMTADHPPTPTLSGKVLCGYQGWFNAPGDGSRLGWRHWGRDNRFEPGSCTIDLWPDVSDLTPAERVATPFKNADGSPAFVYSAHNETTVKRHFAWMRDFGIDGVFVQRFATETRTPDILQHRNVVLNACRAGANENNRSYAVMYDLSGLGEGETQVVIDDWKRLVDRSHIAHDVKDASYLRHKGKPVVAVWGIGFNDQRKYTLDECATLIDFLQHDPKYGGNTVMIGVPTYWRKLDRDTIHDPKLLDVIAKADIVSPWAVGRYDTPDHAARYASEQLVGDVKWCTDRKIDLLPVMFPGFSWHNMNAKSPADQIPRRGGTFLWAQAVADRRAGATMGYVAMFDEMDEGTAIFKLATAPPSGFVNEPDLRADHYLWLTGEITKLFRGEGKFDEALPKRD